MWFIFSVCEDAESKRPQTKMMLVVSFEQRKCRRQLTCVVHRSSQGRHRRCSELRGLRRTRFIDDTLKNCWTGASGIETSMSDAKKTTESQHCRLDCLL